MNQALEVADGETEQIRLGRGILERLREQHIHFVADLSKLLYRLLGDSRR